MNIIATGQLDFAEYSDQTAPSPTRNRSADPALSGSASDRRTVLYVTSSSRKHATLAEKATSKAILELVRLFDEQREEMVAGVVSRCRAESPSFSLLGDESMASFTDGVREQLSLITKYLGGRESALEEGFAAAKEMGALLAREGLPLDALGDAIGIADRLLGSLVDREWEGNVPETLEISRRSRSFALAVQRGSSQAYLESKDRLLSDQVRELQRRARSVRLIHEVGRQLVGANDLETIYRLAVATIVSMMEVSAAALILRDAEGAEPRLAHSIGLPEDCLDCVRWVESSFGKGFEGGKRPVNIHDIAEVLPDSPRLAPLREAGLVSVLAIPIVHEETVIGSVVACSASERDFSESEMESLSALASELGLAITKTRLFDSERRRRRESVTLLEVAEAVSSALRVEEILERVASYALQVSDFRECRIFLYDIAKERLLPKAAAGLNETDRKRFLRSTLRLTDTSLSLRVIGERRFLFLDSSETDSLATPERKAIGISSKAAAVPVAAIPLLLGQRVLGVMYLKAGESPLPEMANLLQAMGRQAAIALENARLFGLTEQKAEQSGALFRASQVIGGEYELPGVCWAIAKEAARLGTASAGALFLWREIEEVLEIVSTHDAGVGILGLKVRSGDGLAGRVAERKEPVIANNYQQWRETEGLFPTAFALMGIPILHQDQLIAVLTLAHLGEDSYFDEEDVRLLSIFALQAATAIQKALLYEDWKKRAWELDKKAAELRAVSEVTRTILSTPHSLERTVAALTSRVRELTACDRVSLALTDPEKNYFQIFGGDLSEGDGGPAKVLPFDGPLAEVVLKNRLLSIENVLTDTDHTAIGNQVFDEKVRSCICIPLVVKGQAIGVLTMGSHVTNAFSPDDLGLAEELAGLAAIALQNAELSQFQQKVLDTMQNALLPETIPPVPGLEIGVYYGSATTRVQIGGDLYDFIFLPEGRTGFVIGDVCGKGIQAASDMAMAKFILRGFALTHPSPASVLHHLNNALHLEMKTGRFVTLFYGLYDPAKETFTYSSGGHPPPVHYRNDLGEAVFLKGSGTALGVFPKLQYQERVVRLRTGDVLVLYTDGVIEARKEFNFFGEERLQELVERENALPAQVLAEAIYRECLVFSEGGLADDLAIMVIKRTR